MAELQRASLGEKADILFFGAAGLDTLTFLDTYPAEDAKVRALQQRIEGGGNAANSAVAASKLGISSHLFSAVGSDINADLILEGLQSQGVDTTHVVKRKGNSGTTYVIVCNSTSTRTCIHNPIANDINGADVGDVFQFIIAEQIQFVHFDSRHTEAAVALAQRITSHACTNTHKKPLVSIDMEKIRPHVLELLPHCDVIFTNQTFPALLLPEESDLTLRLLNTLAQPCANRCKVLITTLGAGGSVLLYKQSDLDSLYAGTTSGGDESDVGSMDSSCGGEWVELENKVNVCTSISTYCETITFADGAIYNMIRTSAFPLIKEQVIDTTGAGDAFIGSFLAALAYGLSLQSCAKLGTVVAAMKIQQPGARQGLPSLADVIHMLQRVLELG